MFSLTNTVRFDFSKVLVNMLHTMLQCNLLVLIHPYIVTEYTLAARGLEERLNFEELLTESVGRVQVP
jgi:hypothetical protein